MHIALDSKKVQFKENSLIKVMEPQLTRRKPVAYQHMEAPKEPVVISRTNSTEFNKILDKPAVSSGLGFKKDLFKGFKDTLKSFPSIPRSRTASAIPSRTIYEKPAEKPMPGQETVDSPNRRPTLLQTRMSQVNQVKQSMVEAGSNRPKQPRKLPQPPLEAVNEPIYTNLKEMEKILEKEIERVDNVSQEGFKRLQELVAEINRRLGVSTSVPPPPPVAISAAVPVAPPPPPMIIQPAAAMSIPPPPPPPAIMSAPIKQQDSAIELKQFQKIPALNIKLESSNDLMNLADEFGLK